MEVYTSITVTMQSIPQAAAFVNAFLDELIFCSGWKFDSGLLALKEFRQKGGSLVLEDMVIICPEDAFRKIFLNTARAVPDTPFEVTVLTSGDMHAEDCFEYAAGVLKRKFWSMDGCWYVRDSCPECETKFSKPVLLGDWIASGRKECCPNCGNLPFEPDEYTAKEEKIRIRAKKIGYDKETVDSLFELLQEVYATQGNRSLVSRSKVCGCGQCMRIFPPSEIRWWQHDGTARCQYCCGDNILADASGFPVTEEFLGRMNRYLKERWPE